LGLLLITVPLTSVVIVKHRAVLKDRYGAFPLGHEDMVDEAKLAGVSYTIRQYQWGTIEPEQDVFDYTMVDDEYFNVLKPNGMGEIMIIRTGQCWATDNEDDSTFHRPLTEFASAPPLDYNDYYDFVYNLVDHFVGEIDHFIIENDPLTLFSWYGTPEEYKQLVSFAYQAAKDANPNCTIIANKFPAMSFGYIIATDLYESGLHQAAMNFWNGYFSRRLERFQVDSLEELLIWLNSDIGLWTVNFTDVIMMADQAENLNMMAFNYYLHYDYIDEIVGWLRFKMAENGYQKNLVDLEHGVKDERLVVSDTTAAHELVKGFTIVQSFGVCNLGYYPFALDTSSLNYWIHSPMYDLTYEEIRPSYYSYTTFTDHFNNFHLFHDKQISFYKRYMFKDLRSLLVELEVIWSDSVDTTVTLPFPESSDLAVITNCFGDSVDSIPNVSDSLIISVDTEPKFLRWIWTD
jgi:hypothetical protein